jgi:hypothetical protein
MRILVFVLLSISVAGCSGQKRPYFMPKTFEYPDDSIGEGKTFTYHDSAHNQDTYIDLRSFMMGRDTLRSYLRYNAKSRIDSQIINHGQLIETFDQLSTRHPRLFKGEQVLDLTIDDGTKLGKNKKSWTYHNDNLTLAISSESQFVKDTSMLWQGRLLPCLVIHSDGKMDVRSKKYASLNYTSTVLYYGYYAKSIGLIKYILAFTDRKKVDHYQRWNLASIENGTKINALIR